MVAYCYLQLENRMINEAVIPTISQTIRTMNQLQLVKPNEVVAAITPIKRVVEVSTHINVDMETSSVHSINTHA